MINFEEEIANLKTQNQYRSIPEIEHKSGRYIFSEGQKYLNLSSNDYLGLAYDENLVMEFLEFVKSSQSPLFSAASARLLTGNHPALTDLEGYLAELFNKERCLLFNSGYHANIGIVSALCEKGCAVFSDKLNHASIIDGMKLSDGDFYRYKHLDYEHLESLLAQKADSYSKVFIISESVFSMDGDVCDIEKLVEIKNKYNAVLIIDEAHAFGVFGQRGCGLSEDIQGVDLVVATFGKALASYGAFVVGASSLIEYLCNKARSFIFSTAIPPINAMWTLWLLQNKIPSLGEKRLQLLALAAKFRQELRKYDIKTLGESQIVPVIIGENEKTVQTASQLKALGYWVLPIRPPTVPKGGARLRFSLNTLMQEDEILPLAKVISEILG